MKAAGIIAEYHPFHNGHAWQIQQLRQNGFDCVVAVMSTGVVQRGECEQMPFDVRVRAAITGGVDLLLALPAPYACLSAEGFARAGVHLLNALGCVQTLCFGAEHPDIKVLLRAAYLLDTPQAQALIRQLVQQKLPFAAARSKAADQLCAGMGQWLSGPNNILAVEYVRALLAMQSSMVPFALPRIGAEHDAVHTVQGYASASWLRAQLAQGICQWRPYVPQACLPIYQQAQQQAMVLDEQAFSTALLGRLRMLEPARLERVRGSGSGLGHRLYKAVRKACSAQQLLALMKTKQYPTARLRRLMLDAALEFTNELPTLPPYLHVLGATKAGCALLHQSKPSLPLDSRLARLGGHSAACACVAQAHSAAVDFAALCLRAAQPCARAYTARFYIGKRNES